MQSSSPFCRFCEPAPNALAARKVDGLGAHKGLVRGPDQAPIGAWWWRIGPKGRKARHSQADAAAHGHREVLAMRPHSVAGEVLTGAGTAHLGTEGHQSSSEGETRGGTGITGRWHRHSQSPAPPLDPLTPRRGRVSVSTVGNKYGNCAGAGGLAAARGPRPPPRDAACRPQTPGPPSPLRGSGCTWCEWRLRRLAMG